MPAKTQKTVLVPTKDGKSLEGLLHQPTGSGPFPAVLFVSGLGMTMHEGNNSFDEIAQRLGEKGILTLEFQFPIFLENDICRELPLTQRAYLTAAALQYLRQRHAVDRNRIGVIAQSYGAATVLGMDTSAVKTVALISGAWFPKNSIVNVYKEKGVVINYEGDTSLPRSSGENTTVGKEFWEDIEHFDTLEQAEKLHMPVLIIHGNKDSKVPVSDAEKVFASIPSKNKKLKIFRGGDHGIVNVPRVMRGEFVGDLISWFQETL
jgi:dienelactone hydrolase